MNRTFVFFIITIVLGLTAVFFFPYYAINPGVLVRGHSQLRNDCFACHSPLEGATTAKCISCHPLRDIGVKKAVDGGGIIPNDKITILHTSITDIQCSACHTEHNGASRESANLHFSHSILSKKLLSSCNDCHADKKPQNALHTKVTLDCSSCHNTETWQLDSFDHNLPIDIRNNCNQCHQQEKPKDGIHSNLTNNQQCSQCHTVTQWVPSTFEHSQYFRFDEHHPSDCKGCHNNQNDYKQYTCYNCHEHEQSRISAKHLKEGIRNFTDCVRCHRSGNEHEAKNNHAEGENRKRNDHREGEKRNDHREHDDD